MYSTKLVLFKSELILQHVHKLIYSNFSFNLGQETTAALLASLFLELGRNEDVLEK